MQLSEPNWFRLVYYSSQKLSTVERNYSTTERKALGMMYSINKFSIICWGESLCSMWSTRRYYI